MPADLSSAERHVPESKELPGDIGDERVIEAIGDPEPEGMHFEEYTFLAELVELWVAIEKTSRDELVKNAHNEWGKNSEEDIVEREGPGFIDDLA